METNEKNKEGRPSKYNKDFHPKLVYYMALKGMIDEDIAKELNISESTLNNWKKNYPEFLESIKRGKEDPDRKVEAALLSRALGYEHDEEKVFCQEGEIITHDTTKHYPPETAAMIFWLKNRQPKRWRDKQDIDLNAKLEILEPISLGDLESQIDDENPREE